MKQVMRQFAISVGSIICLNSGLASRLLAADAVEADVSTNATTLRAVKSESETNELTEITVTANKREQSLNTVDMSINAYTGAQLANLRVNDIADLANFVPGMTVAASTRGAPIYTLRGVGFYDDSVAGKPDVSVYIDQIPLGLSVMSELTAFDLERVEVLKGPQGTLFGNNATGGAINFVAAKPTSELSSGFVAGYGSYETTEFSGFVSGPMVDDGSVRARLSFKARQGNGWQQSYTRGAGVQTSVPAENIYNSNIDTNGSTDEKAARLLVDWDPSDKLKFEIDLNGWINRDQPLANQYIKYLPNAPVAGQPLASYPLAPLTTTAADWVPGIPRRDDRFWQIAARADWQFWSDLTLTDLISLSAMQVDVGLSPAGVNLHIFDLPAESGPVRAFSEELRLANASTNPYRYVIGANYADSTVSERDPSYYPDQTVAVLDGFSGGTAGAKQRSKTYAVFGNLEYDAFKQLTLKGGLRYSEEKTAATFFDGASPGYLDPGTFGGPFVQTPAYIAVNGAPGYPGEGLTNFLNYLGHILYPSTWTSVCSTCSVIFDHGHSDPLGYSASESEKNVAFSTGVDYKPADNTLLYITVSKGYKAGGFATLAAATTAALAPVKQESVLAYEVGFKTNVLNRHVNITGAVFYYDYTNKQELEIIVDPLFNQLNALVNIPKSRIYGAETDLTVNPIDGLTFDLNGTYLNGKVTSYNGVVGSKEGSGNLGFVPITTSLAGADLAFTPTWDVIGRVDYRRAITNKINGFIGANANFRSKMLSQVIPNSLPTGIDVAQSPSAALYYINARTLLGANFGIASSDGRWTLTFWGKNLGNIYYWNNVLRTEDTVVRVPGEGPRTVGVSGAYKF